ncbi:hypothetical protein SAMN05192558_106357 [Actinokineospora alba]|uniref:Lipoprotein n=1 Tax=Actinokineospora alba TaxID=504798 RepID=A0A1H0Q1C9_9PSEU|nr:hypothetical protein [Actinokineospora alba]TDP66029.1 hypothetical protein C8E96_1524 [Actinokineospora alba]SDI59606.1 hypothetical protein SAMN05421871_10695 [Actinokineospora alba]SDP11144.1 hypothetical protein SAMN05192558_106357 [Actinokineospora alba]
MKRSVGVLAIACLALTACGEKPAAPNASPSSTAAPKATGLTGALAGVRANDSTRERFEYADLTKIKQLKDTKNFGMVGSSQITESPKKLKDLLALDLAAFEEAVTAGKAPAAAGRLRGPFDSAAVNSAIANKAAKPEAFSAVRAAGSELLYSSAAAQLDWFAEGAGSLAEDKTMAAHAGCLGDVAAAAIGPIASAGVRIDGKDDTTDLICLKAHSPEDAAEMKIQIEATLKGAKTSSGTPWSRVVPKPTVDVVGDTVRITSTSAAAGTVIAAFAKGDIERLPLFE